MTLAGSHIHEDVASVGNRNNSDVRSAGGKGERGELSGKKALHVFFGGICVPVLLHLFGFWFLQLYVILI